MRYQSSTEIADKILADSKPKAPTIISRPTTQSEVASSKIEAAFIKFDNSHHNVLTNKIKKESQDIIQILDKYIDTALNITSKEMQNEMNIKEAGLRTLGVDLSKCSLFQSTFLQQFDDLPIPVILWAFHKEIEIVTAKGYPVIPANPELLISIIVDPSKEDKSVMRFSMNYFDNQLDMPDSDNN